MGGMRRAGPDTSISTRIAHVTGVVTRGGTWVAAPLGQDGKSREPSGRGRGTGAGPGTAGIGVDTRQPFSWRRGSHDEAAPAVDAVDRVERHVLLAAIAAQALDGPGIRNASSVDKESMAVKHGPCD